MEIEGSKTTRAIALAKRMAQGKEMTVKDIMSYLGYRTRKSVYEILATLEDLGIPVVEDRHGRANVYTLEREDLVSWGLEQARSVLSDDDARMISFLFENAGRSSAIMGIGGDRLLERLSDALNLGKGMEKRKWSGNFFKADRTAYDNLSRLLEACEKEISCTVTYRNVEGEMKTYTVWPKKCRLADGGIYCLAANSHGKLIHLALQRLVSLSLDQNPKPCPPLSEDPERIIQDPFSIVRQEKSEHFVILLDQDQGWYEEQKAWPDNVSVRRNDDGSCTFTADTKGRYWLMRYVLSLGSSARVISPESFRREVEEEVKKMCALYSVGSDRQ